MKKTRTYHLLLLVLTLLVPGLTAVAQPDYPYATPRYPFVDAKASVLHFPGNPASFASFYKKMDDLVFRGMGQVNIVHIGGSHVQADMWTDRLRQRFQTAFDGVRGSRGLVFPYRIAGTNGPMNYLVDYTGNWETCKNIQQNRVCTLGLTGYVVTTTDTNCRVNLQFRDPERPKYDFNQIRLFHDMDSSSYSVTIRVNGSPVPVVQNKDLGYSIFRLGAHVQTMSLEIRKTDSLQNHFSLYGLSLDNDDPGFIWHGVGVNGASTQSYLRCNLFTKHLTAIKPDLVVFSIGINDANTLEFDERFYERNYDSLVAWVRKANPEASVLFTTNTDSYYKKKYPNKNASKVRDVMMRLGKRHDAAVWDAFAVMGGLGSIKEWIKAGLANTDKVHLLRGGYELLADHMFNAMMQHYDQHLQETAPKTN